MRLLRGTNQLKPVQVGAISLLIALLFVGVRLVRFPSHSVGDFVYAGKQFADPHKVDVPIRDQYGYDGQFEYRIARSPFNFDNQAAGVRIDTPQRFERYLYGFFAWALSFGHAGLVPLSLVAVNVIAFGFLGLLSALLMVAYDRKPAWGFALVLFSGFGLTMARDLTEVTAACFIVGGLLALKREGWLFAAIAFSLGVLTRETVALIPAAIGLDVMYSSRQRRSLREIEYKKLLVGCAGIATLVTWQVFLRNQVGVWPFAKSGGQNLTIPFSDFGRIMGTWIKGFFHGDFAKIRWLDAMIALIVIVGFAFGKMRSSKADRSIKIALVLYLLMAVSLSHLVWEGPADFRVLYESYLMAVIVILTSDEIPVLVPWIIGAMSTLVLSLRALSG